MKWLIAGMRQEFVESFVQWMKENGIRVSEPFELSGIWEVMYMLLMHFPTNLCHAGICSMAFLINLEL